jgi:hypothetical protein
MSQPTMERERDRRSLKDLAKLANSPSLTPTPPPSKAAPPVGGPSSQKLAAATSAPPSSREAGDSGIVDLKMMAQVDPHAAERAKDTKLATAELFDEEPPSEKKPPSSASLSAASAAAATSTAGRVSAAPASGKLAAVPTSAPASAPASAPTAARATPASEPKKGGMLWLGIGGVVAAAAAAVLMLRSQPSEAPAASTKASPAAVAPPPAPAAKQAAAPKEEAKVAENTPPPSEPDQAVDPSSLPHASAPRAPAGQPGGAHAVAPGPEKSVAVAGKSAPTKPVIVANNLPENPASDGLDKALRQAAGPTDTPSEGAANSSSRPQFDPGSVPQKPAAGAIAGGIGSVMSEARACLGLDDPISYASITFASAGTVSSVSISGFAAGKPAEGCIKAALSKAKVPPFAQPSYTQKVTVRPNS